MATAGMETLDTASPLALLGPQPTAEQAAPIFQQGWDAIVSALLCLNKRLAEERVAVLTTPDPSACPGVLRPELAIP